MGWFQKYKERKGIRVANGVPNTTNGNGNGNGRDWKTKLGDRFINTVVDNWGGLLTKGIGVAFACWLLWMFQNQYTQDRAAARDEQTARTALLEKTNETYRSAFDKLAEVIIITQKRQDEANLAAIDFYKKTTVMHDTQLKVMNETQRCFLEGEKRAHDERMEFWKPTQSLLKNMEESDRRREGLQVKILEEHQKTNKTEEAKSKSDPKK